MEAPDPCSPVVELSSVAAPPPRWPGIAHLLQLLAGRMWSPLAWRPPIWGRISQIARSSIHGRRPSLVGFGRQPLLYVEIPLVSVGDDGRVFTVGGKEGKTKYELVNREKRKLTLGDIPFPLTCALHKDSILADPTAEEESIIETSVTVVLDSSGRIVSIQKPGGGVASMSTIKTCISLAKERGQKLKEIVMDSVEAMEVDQAE